jgi:DNA-binding transcriptional ArsR family regulator
MKPTNLSTKRQRAIARALRDLEREGLIESRLDREGNVRWYSTKKIRHVRPDEVHVCTDLLN